MKKTLIDKKETQNVQRNKAGATYIVGKIKTLLLGKVDKENGKGLSANDYTNVEKAKLAGVESGANNYTLPTASTSVLGGVKVGAGLEIIEGTLSATGRTSHTDNKHCNRSCCRSCSGCA